MCAPAVRSWLPALSSLPSVAVAAPVSIFHCCSIRFGLLLLSPLFIPIYVFFALITFAFQLGRSNPSLWPRAQYLPQVELFALPYAVPFWSLECLMVSGRESEIRRADVLILAVGVEPCYDNWILKVQVLCLFFNTKESTYMTWGSRFCKFF